MSVNLRLTAFAIEGMLERKLDDGWHPSEPVALPLTLAEWDAIHKALVASSSAAGERS